MQRFLVEAVALGLVAVGVGIVAGRKEPGAKQFRELVRLQPALGGDQRDGVAEPAPWLAGEDQIGGQLERADRPAQRPDGEVHPDRLGPGRQGGGGVSRPFRQREVLERILLAAGGEVGGDAGDPVETVIPVVAGKPAVGLEEAGRHAGPLRGAKEGLGLGRLRVGVHDQGAMAGHGELRRFAPVVDMRGGGPPGTQHGRRRRDVDAGLPGPLPVVEGGTRVGARGQGAVDGQARGVPHRLQEIVLDGFLPGRQHQLEIGAVADIGADRPGAAMDGLDRGESHRQGQAVEVEVGVVVAAMAVAEDAEGEAAPGLGMDRAVEKGPAVELLSARLGGRKLLKEDRQRVMPGGILGRIADRGGGFGGLERYRRPVRKRRPVVGMNFGLGLAQEMFRGEIDPPAGHGAAIRRARARRHGAAAARQAGETEAGGVLAADQVVGPAVLTEAQKDGGVGDAGAVVANGDGETRFGASLVGTRGDGDPHPRGIGATAVLQRLRHDIRKRAGVNPRDPPDGTVVDAGANRPGGRTGNLGHAWTSVRGVETETPRPACPGL